MIALIVDGVEDSSERLDEWCETKSQTESTVALTNPLQAA